MGKNRLNFPVPALFIGSGIAQYVGAAIAVGLFIFMSPLGVVWWRMALGAVVLLIIWRPWRMHWDARALLLATMFGLMLGGMNTLFYESIAHIPLGTAVSVEFVGPVAVALLRSRGPLPRIAALLALAGIVLIGGWGIDLSEPVVLTGFLFALGAAVTWAGYILLGSYISRRGKIGPSLAVGLTVAAFVYLPFFFTSAFLVDFTWSLVLMLLGVGVFSTAIPYSIDALAFGRVKADVFALLQALLPATSVIVGAVMLSQLPNAFELLGLVLVSIAVWLAGRVPNTPSAAIADRVEEIP